MGTIPPFYSLGGGGGFGITGSPATGWTFPKTAETGAAEQIITMTVSDDAVASLKINNGISSASTYVPRIQAFGTNSAAASRHALVIEPRLGSGVDSGVVPTMLFNFFLGPTGSSAISVRPLISFQNAGTEVTSLSAAGAWTIDGGSAPALTMGGRINLKSYTVATLPSAATAGGIVYVSDAAVAPCLAFTNGTNWKRCDNAATTVV